MHINSLPNSEMLNCFQIKTFAYYKINASEMLIAVFDDTENMTKSENSVFNRLSPRDHQNL